MTQPDRPARPAPTLDLALLLQQMELVLQENMGNRITPALCMGMVTQLQQVVATKFLPRGPVAVADQPPEREIP